MPIRIFQVVNSQRWQVGSEMIGEKGIYHCRVVLGVGHEERMGLGGRRSHIPEMNYCTC